MSINVAKLELAMMQKINNASTELELLTYQKILEQLRTGSVRTVSTYADLPSYSENVGKLYFVESEETVYWANASVGWVTLQSQSARQAFGIGFQSCSLLINGTTNIATSSPTQEICSSNNWDKIQLSSNGTNGLGLKTDGTLWSWGAGSCYVHGHPTTLPCVIPTELKLCTTLNSVNDWCEMSQARCNGYGIRTNGTLWAWGKGNFGANGNGSTSNNIYPTQEVSSSTNWKEVDGGYEIAIATKTDGTLWTWGYNNLGQLGTNNTVNYSSPVQEASSSSNWSKISSDIYNAFSIKTDGTLWAWGENNSGQLATNNIVCYSSPVQEITSSTDWCFIRHGGSSYGIKTDGALWAWGFNIYGKLGTNDVIARSSPVQEISSSTNWNFIGYIGAASGVLATKTDTTLWGWGYNNYNKLYLTVQEINCQFSSPVQAYNSSTGWVYASSTPSASFAIKQTDL